jgi:hypothetical protein
MDKYKDLLYTLRWFGNFAWDQKKSQNQAIDQVSKALSLTNDEGDISALYTLRWYFTNRWGFTDDSQEDVVGIITELLEDTPTHIDHDRIPNKDALVGSDEEELKIYKPVIKKAEIASGIKVGLAIGHNQFTGARSYKGDDEWTTRKAVTLHAVEILAEYGVESKIFIRDRSKGYTTAMKQHGADMRMFGSQVNLEMHFNSAGPTATGTEIICVSEKSGKYFRPLCKHFADYYDMPIRGDHGAQVKSSGRGIAFAKYTPNRSGVWEGQFASSKQDWDKVDDKPKEEGETFAYGLLECLEQDYR